MGPKTFISCYICLKEFGSRSITFHEPKCLERWRSSNKNLPSEKRSSTPVKPPGWNNRQDCVSSHCQISVPTFKKDEQAIICFSKKLKPDNNSDAMTGVVKTDFSPKKGKENKNNSNHIPIPSIGKKNAKNDTKSESKIDSVQKDVQNNCPMNSSEEDSHKDSENTSTSKRSVRPQTKILRRPTPNLKHPVIQVDSDDSSGDSSCSDKSKEDNPKRLKMGNESSDSTHKPKNFIIYNKNNVEKNTKNTPKERTSATLVASIPNPCNSCNRSQAPERLHSHAKKDSRGLMYRKSPSLDVKATSPQQKLPEVPEKSPTLDVKMTSPQKKVSESLDKLLSVDVKITSPNQKIPRLLDKSSLDFKITSVHQKVSESSDKSSSLEVKMISPQQKVPRILEKSPSLDIKATSVNQKVSESSNRERSLDIKMIHPQQKLSKLLDKSPSLDFKPASLHQRGLEASNKSPPLDVKMTSPQKKVLRTPPFRTKLLSKDSKRTQDQQCVNDSPYILSGECAVKKESLEVPGDNFDLASTPDEALVELEKSCYICHEEFKVSALQLHESKCLENWKKENNSLTANLRKLPPRRPEEDDDLPPDEDDPAWTSVQSQLVPCPVCSRTFFPERMPVHRRVCKGKPSPKPLKRASSLREQSASSTDGEDQKPAPIYVPCYVCGRSYGSWVISMHEQQCLRKWRRDNEKLPDDEQQEEPKRFSELSADDDVASLIELGNNAWESHLQQLVPCPLCSRTFFPDRLGVHKRSCKGPPNCARRPRSNKGA